MPRASLRYQSSAAAAEYGSPWTSQGTEQSCSTAPATSGGGGGGCAVVKIIEAGAMTRDGAGNGCGTHVAVVNTVPLGSSPPTVAASITTVIKVTYYNPTTGTGDESLNEYFGGSCNGTTFSSAGATQVVTGTLHFTESNGGNRIDSVVTAFQLLQGGLGGYSISFTELQQSPGKLLVGEPSAELFRAGRVLPVH